MKRGIVLPEAPKLYRVREVAELFRVDRRAVYAWIRAGRVYPFRTPSGRIFITESEVRRLLSGEVAPEDG